MKSLVTGGAGFIGSNLVQALLKMGHEVTVLDNLKRGNKLDRDQLRAVQLIVGDIRDEATVARAVQGCDWVFHFAAVLGVDVVADNPVETMETEVIGTKNVAQGAIANGCSKLIYASTSGVYGKSAIERAVDEEFAVSPSSSYSIAKRFNEIYLKALFQEKGLLSVSLRFFNVYGPRQDTRMVIPRFFEQALNGQPISIYGTGNQTRDFTYVDDVVESTVRLAKAVEGCEIVNVSNNTEYTITDLAKKIIEVTGSSSKLSYITPPSGRYDFEVERRFGSSAKLEKLTGFHPHTDLKDGLSRFHQYLQAAKKSG
jgi:UDP-glucose 4-epimerase